MSEGPTYSRAPYVALALLYVGFCISFIDRAAMSLALAQVGKEFNFHRAATVDELIRALSPWAFDVSHPLGFGGRVYASTLLNFIEELPYVDYVTDFKLLTDDGTGTFVPVEHADPRTPDAILISDETHDIGEVKP